MGHSPTQMVHGNFPVDQYPAGDIRNGAATPDPGPAVPTTTLSSTGDAAVEVGLAYREQAVSAFSVTNMSNPGTHSAKTRRPR